MDIFPLRPSWLSSEPSSVSSSDESTSWMASCFCRDSLRSALSCLMADSLSFSLLFPADRPSEPDTTPSVPSPSCRPNFLDEEECLCRLPFSTPRPAEDSRPSLDDSWRLCKLGSLCRISFLNSECEMSRLCLRLPTAAPTASFFSAAAAMPEDEGELVREAASFSADCTLLRSGERGGSALLGLDICLTRGGEEWSFTGND